MELGKDYTIKITTSRKRRVRLYRKAMYSGMHVISMKHPYPFKVVRILRTTVVDDTEVFVVYIKESI